MNEMVMFLESLKSYTRDTDSTLKNKKIDIIIEEIKWRNVENELPRKGERVIMLINNVMPCEGWINENGIWYRYDDKIDVENFLGKVTYWKKMPINNSDIKENRFPVSMDVYTKPGQKIKYIGRGGTDADEILANKLLILNNVYTISEIFVYTWNTDVVLEEFPGEIFNSVMFENI